MKKILLLLFITFFIYNVFAVDLIYDYNSPNLNFKFQEEGNTLVFDDIEVTIVSIDDEITDFNTTMISEGIYLSTIELPQDANYISIVTKDGNLYHTYIIEIERKIVGVTETNIFIPDTQKPFYYSVTEVLGTSVFSFILLGNEYDITYALVVAAIFIIIMIGMYIGRDRSSGTFEY